MPWYFVGHNGAEKIAYGKRARFALDRYFDMLEAQGDLKVGDVDFWINVRELSPKQQKVMSGSNVEGVHDMDVLANKIEV